MPGQIYLIQNGDTLQAMHEKPYASEDLLQTLLARYPDLLAGDQMDENRPRRWLLISREMGIPGEEEGGNRWSLDHLYLDQDGIPTLVEVKRASDTRLRREVVGQILDYAANAVVYWPVATLRGRFEVEREAQSLDPDQLVRDLTEADPEDENAVDNFWEQVKTNLAAAKIRLVFVADEIPTELRRIVEFLNAHMDPVEVLAVEIKQYVGEGLRTLVPKVVGQTAEAQARKTGGRAASRQWDKPSFLAELTARWGTEQADVARQVLNWAQMRGLRIWWGKGSRSGCFIPMFDFKGGGHSTIAVWTYGRVETQFQWMKTQPPFSDASLRRELLDRFNQIPGVALPADGIERRPAFSLDVLKNEEAMDAFLASLDWLVEQCRGSTGERK